MVLLWVAGMDARDLRISCAPSSARLSQSANAQADSEDVAQEVICRAYTGISRFRGEALLETWLQSIAHYAIILPIFHVTADPVPPLMT